MSWSSDEFEEVFSNIWDELLKDNFFEMMMITDVERYMLYVRTYLKEAEDDHLLSEVLRLALKDYNSYELDNELELLSEKGLIRMVVNENGELAYEATEDGLLVNDMVNEAISQIDKQEQKSHKIMDIKYSEDVYKVVDSTDGMRLVDHGNNYEFMIIPAGKQHDGEEFVEFYHTIFTHYHDPSPNGQYELVDEVRLYDILNNNYNQSK